MLSCKDHIAAFSGNHAKSFLSIACAVFFSGCVGSQAIQESMQAISKTGGDNPESPNYIIKLKDLIRITVSEYREFDTTATVGESGSILLRILGDIPAAGLTKAQLAKDLSSRFSLYTKNTVTVDLFIANKEMETVTVIGNVGRQGVFPSPPDGSLLGVIATAGGSNLESDLRHIKIFRRGDLAHPVEVDLSLTLNVQGTDQNLPSVGPGDIVYVPKEENLLRDLSNYFRDTFFLFSVLTFIR